jgi:hypothetical protein
MRCAPSLCVAASSSDSEPPRTQLARTGKSEYDTHRIHFVRSFPDELSSRDSQPPERAAEVQSRSSRELLTAAQRQ